MKLTPILYMSAAMLMLLSCGNTTTNDNHEDSLWTSPAVSNEIIDLGTIERSYTFTLRGKVYRYEFRLASVDSLPIIVNSDGTRYYDNDVTLTVRHDSTVVLRRRFTKHSFASHVPADQMRNSALVGFSFDFTHADDHNYLRFIATVGDPDETTSVNYPVEVRVAPDGTYSLFPAEDFETESLFEGINEDPSDNLGV